MLFIRNSNNQELPKNVNASSVPRFVTGTCKGTRGGGN